MGAGYRGSALAAQRVTLREWASARDSSHDRVAQFDGRRRTPQVRRQGSAFANYSFDGGLKSLGSFGEPQVLEHQGAAPYGANRISTVRAGDIRRRPMNRLRHRP